MKINQIQTDNPEKEYYSRAILIKEEFIKYVMQRDKRLLGNRIEYIKYFLNVWLPTNDSKVGITEAVFELSRYHLFVSEKTIWTIMKQNEIKPN